MREKRNPAYSVLNAGRRGILMSEIKVNNGNIEDALKRFKRQCEMGFFKKFVKENIMKNLA